MSRLDVIAGPNGAGKTTLYERVIHPSRPGLPFVNADRIAHDRFLGEQMPPARDAARIAARARAALIDARLDFCAETVFSHPSKVELVTTAVAAGYDVVLHAVLIPLELSGPRVAARVAAGGHDVPAEKLTARYQRLWPLIVRATPHCYRTVFWDNAADDGPFEVGSYRFGVADYPPRWPDWTPHPLRELCRPPGGGGPGECDQDHRWWGASPGARCTSDHAHGAPASRDPGTLAWSGRPDQVGKEQRWTS